MFPVDICHITDKKYTIDVTKYWDSILKYTPWTFTGSSGHPEENFRHWCYYIESEDTTPIYHLTENLWKDICPSIKLNTDLDLTPFRKIINCYNHGDTSYTHRDSGQWTIIVYMNPKWDMNWGGYTVICNDSLNEIYKCVYPEPGSILVFPGRMQHRPTAVERNAPYPRIGITFHCNEN